EGIIDRRFVLCDFLKNNFDLEELLTRCPDCLRCFALCCKHYDGQEKGDANCHHLRLVFTDGACLRNGRNGATSGMGIVRGMTSGLRTSQRAELLAALEGLRRICKEDEEALAEAYEEERQRLMRGEFTDPTCLIVVTDSEYVVKGMTEWVPAWKANGWRTSRGNRPSNIDLFRKLDAEVNSRELIHRVK
ncbi:ribonuclease H-like protein, partial [Leucogyrophana mollusca]